MKVTMLGSGGSGGVPLPTPVAADGWGRCDPANPRNRRRRVSVLVETAGRSVLIDPSPDLREQVLAHGLPHLDAVLFTHAHADHCHGIDDLRSLVYARKHALPAYMTAETRRQLTTKFDYIFTSSHTLQRLYPALMDDRVIADNGPFEAAGVAARAFRQNHGNIDSTGFRIGRFAYSTDVVELDEAAFEALRGVDLWIVDCLRFEPHPTHAHFDRTMEWINRVRPRHAILTHMNQTMDYETVRARCPTGVEPGYDGLVVEIAD